MTCVAQGLRPARVESEAEVRVSKGKGRAVGHGAIRGREQLFVGHNTRSTQQGITKGNHPSTFDFR